MFLADGISLSAQMADGSSFSLILVEETFQIFCRPNLQKECKFHEEEILFPKSRSFTISTSLLRRLGEVWGLAKRVSGI